MGHYIFISSLLKYNFPLTKAGNENHEHKTAANAANAGMTAVWLFVRGARSRG